MLPQLFSIPHDACRESTHDGVSEWQLYCPGAETIEDEWLARTPGLHSELVSYAHRAKIGMVR